MGHPIAWFGFLCGLPLAEVVALMFLLYKFACDQFSFDLPKNVSFIPLLKNTHRIWNSVAVFFIQALGSWIYTFVFVTPLYIFNHYFLFFSPCVSVTCKQLVIVPHFTVGGFIFLSFLVARFSL